MRINKFVANSTGISRRAADEAISKKRVRINNNVATLGDVVEHSDKVYFDNKLIRLLPTLTLLINKPSGYVCSRNGQGSPTVYDLLPAKYHHLKTVGRLDKDSSGLLIMTNDGDLANKLSHPRGNKIKTYQVKLDQAPRKGSIDKIMNSGVMLEDGLSKFEIKKVSDDNLTWMVFMSEGRNRQIRRTFETIGLHVISLHRTRIGDYSLGAIEKGDYRLVNQ